MVQEFGLELLLRQDNIESAGRFVDDYRLAMLARGGDPLELFSDYFPAEPTAADDELDEALREGTSLDLTGVAFDVPDAEELAMLESLLADNQVDIGPGEDGTY